ncbi:hypothetical protein BU17DRAFT_72810 [Hysterangium stoloniferum]|nr:hypothetical protein BU17DRAFT_72810 [Hysterangium stoloniferum]
MPTERPVDQSPIGLQRKDHAETIEDIRENPREREGESRTKRHIIQLEYPEGAQKEKEKETGADATRQEGTGILLNSDIRGRIAVAPKRISTNPPSLPLDEITPPRRAIFSNAAAFNVSIEGRDVVHALQPPRRYNSPSLLQTVRLAQSVLDGVGGGRLCHRLRDGDCGFEKRVAGGKGLTLSDVEPINSATSHCGRCIIGDRTLSFGSDREKPIKKAKAQIAPVQEWEVNSVCNSCCTVYMEKTRCEPQLQSDVVDSLNNTTSRRRVSVTLKNGGANAVEGMKPRGKTLNLMAVPISSWVYYTIKEPVMNLLETVEIEKHKEDSKKAKILGATAVLPLRAPESTATYVDRSVDQGDEARFWVELTHINRLEDALSLMSAV